MANVYGNAFVDVSPRVYGAKRPWGELSGVGGEKSINPPDNAQRGTGSGVNAASHRIRYRITARRRAFFLRCVAFRCERGINNQYV